MIKVSKSLYIGLIALSGLFCIQSAVAQKTGSRLPQVRVTPFTSEVHIPTPSEKAVSANIDAPSGLARFFPSSTPAAVRDTLRNFVKGNFVFLNAVSDLVSDQSGWIQGTNSYEDISKATRISLPSGVTTAQLSEVHVTFMYKANQVTTENYAIEIFAVDTDGGPGNLLASEVYSYQFVNADEDINTPAFTTLHALSSPVTVPDEFFISVNLGAYGAGQYFNIAIASTDLLDRFVSEDWEQLSDGSWINMSDSWFPSSSNNGWLMWLEAVVDYNTGGGGNGPTIQHTQILTAEENTDLVVRANFISPSGISEAAIGYLQGGSSSTTPGITAMTNVGGNTWEGTLPGSLITLSGFQYAVAATDNTNVTSATNVFNVNVNTPGINRNLGIQGSSASDYRLFSIPINLTNTNPASVLEDDLGVYDSSVWRLFGLNANQSYSEFPSSGPMRAGAAFWLATAEGNSINTGPGTSTALGGEFAVPLNAGWTFVGTPFNYAVSQGQVRLASGSPLDIRAFNGSWGVLNGALQPFSGYAVAATATDQLLVLPFPTPAKQSSPVPEKPELRYDWSVQIVASSGNVIDNDNLAGVAPNAHHGWDLMDRPEPPVIGSYISLYFPHADWDVPFARFNEDVRPMHQPLEEWAFEVSTNLNGLINLSFEGIQDVPDAYEIALIDHLLNTRQDLRDHPIYSTFASEEPYAKRFSLVIGESSAVRNRLDLTEVIPTSTILTSFPNPFHSNSTLQIGLKSDTRISLVVYNSLGKKVTTLLSNESRTAGFHTLNWDGKNDAGQTVASGVYFYTLQADGEVITRQIILVR